MTIFDQFHCYVNGLEESFLVNAAEHEAAFVKSFWTLGAGADAHGGEGMAHGGKEAALLGQGAAVGNHTEGVHLQAVVVMESQWFMLNNSFIQLET